MNTMFLISAFIKANSWNNSTSHEVEQENVGVAENRLVAYEIIRKLELEDPTVEYFVSEIDVLTK